MSDVCFRPPEILDGAEGWVRSMTKVSLLTRPVFRLVALVAFLLAGLTAVFVGEAAATAGNSACPRGGNGEFFASDFCFTGTVSGNDSAYIQIPGSGGARFGAGSGAYVKDKVSEYGGANGCANFIEGGVVILEDHTTGFNEAGGTYDYEETRVNGADAKTILNYYSGADAYADSYWRGGTAGWDVYVDGNNGLNTTGIGFGGCYSEAGNFIQAPSGLPNAIAAPVPFTNLTVNFASGGGQTSFPGNDYVIDDPVCFANDPYACMNGTFASGSQWNASSQGGA